MNLQELIAKMEQIEQQVALTLHDYPEGWVEERQKLIAAIARQVRAHLEAEHRLEAARQRVVNDEGHQRPGGPRQQS
jgi:hypothetical protein